MKKFSPPITWSIEPSGVGGIDANGIYTAPDFIDTKQEVQAVAKDADGKEIGKAMITLLPKGIEEHGSNVPDKKAVVQPSIVCLREEQKQQFCIPMNQVAEPDNPPVPLAPPVHALSVKPETVELREGEQLAFRVEPKEQAATWQATVGDIDATGVYTAPKKICSQQSVIITAKSLDGAKYGNATVTLSNVACWTRVLAILWLSLSLLLTVIIICLWPSLATYSSGVSVIVNPPLVTLGLQSKQQFSADIIGAAPDSAKSVTWKSSDGSDVSNGVYTPSEKAQPGRIQITATSKEDSTHSGQATVYLTKDRSMAVLPTSIALHASQTMQFAVVSPLIATAAEAVSAPAGVGDASKLQNLSDIKWYLSRNDLGEIDSNGKYTAPLSIERTYLVTVLAVNAKLDSQAAANITLLGPQEGPNKTYLILFVIVMGMLGSVVHSVMSFTEYVGNRSFVSSWSLWYVFRPFVGGTTALFFFFLVGMGKVTTITMDPMSLGLVCGLVGLFSDTAIRKLAEVFRVVFGTREDPRADKLPEGEASKTSTVSTTSQGPSPTISELDPKSAKEKAKQLVTVTGTNFSEGATVRVKSAIRKPTNVSSARLQVELTPEDLTGEDVEIVVINADGTQSNVKKLIVSK